MAALKSSGLDPQLVKLLQRALSLKASELLGASASPRMSIVFLLGVVSCF